MVNLLDLTTQTLKLTLVHLTLLKANPRILCGCVCCLVGANEEIHCKKALRT